MVCRSVSFWLASVEEIRPRTTGTELDDISDRTSKTVSNRETQDTVVNAIEWFIKASWQANYNHKRCNERDHDERPGRYALMLRMRELDRRVLQRELATEALVTRRKYTKSNNQRNKKHPVKQMTFDARTERVNVGHDSWRNNYGFT